MSKLTKPSAAPSKKKVERKPTAVSNHVSRKSSVHLREHPEFRKFTEAMRQFRTPLADLVKSSSDEKTRSACLPNEVVAFNALRSAARSLLGTDEFRTHLCWGFSVASSTSASNAYASTLDPNLSAEASSFQALFDEMKMVSGRTDWAYSSTVVPNAGQDAIIYYDPVSSAVPTSVVSGMVASQKEGPYSIMPIPGGNGAGPITMNGTGHFAFHFRMPKGPQGTDFASSSNCTGQWIDVNATSPNWGYVKIFANGNSTAVTVVHGYLTVAMLYRCRQ